MTLWLKKFFLRSRLDLLKDNLRLWPRIPCTLSERWKNWCGSIFSFPVKILTECSVRVRVGTTAMRCWAASRSTTSRRSRGNCWTRAWQHSDVTLASPLSTSDSTNHRLVVFSHRSVPAWRYEGVIYMLDVRFARLSGDWPTVASYVVCRRDLDVNFVVG